MDARSHSEYLNQEMLTPTREQLQQSEATKRPAKAPAERKLVHPLLRHEARLLKAERDVAAGIGATFF